MDFTLHPAPAPLLASGIPEFVWWIVGLSVVVGGALLIVRYLRLSETSIQETVHKLEQGGWVRRVQVVIVLASLAFMIYLWFFKEGCGFRGLPHEKAIEQAQIARELARGHGFSTKVIRPAALWQFEQSRGTYPIERTPDTFYAPLHPFITSLVFRYMDWVNGLMQSWSQKSAFFERFTYEKVMTTKLLVYAYDRIIAITEVLFFVLAAIVNYFTARRLFDDRLAVISVGLLLLCEKCWEFCMSGLPQMFMLLLFSGAAYTMVRAVEAKEAGGKFWPWLVGNAAAFGLLALTHGLTIWLFAGALLFSFLYFRPRWSTMAIMLGVFFLFYGPWMVRNQSVCGSPVGLGWYSGLHQVRGTESQIMRSMEMPLSGVSPSIFRSKIQGLILFQLQNIYDFLGYILPAPFFFIALLHVFKKPETSVFRWYVLVMWLFGVVGMAVFGMSEPAGSVRANDLHILFVPCLTFYGLALILVMWTRLNITVRLARIAFIVMLFILSSLPFINEFIILAFSPPSPPYVSWPPYVPPWISILAKWTREEEIISSDMPWAVAWYADRESLWVPMSIHDWHDLNDYHQLKGRIVGLYLTPITGNKPFFSEIMKGEWKEWAPFITHNVNLKDFPLKAVTALPIEGECVYFSDRDRWTNREE